MEVLSIKNLYKSFGEKEVLRGVDLIIPKNSIFGFIGKNGAGKTTVMKCVLGLLKPDSGEIKVLGEDVRFGNTPTNKYIGYLPDVPEFYSFMSAREYLHYCGKIIGMKKKDIEERTEELLKTVGLSSEKSRIAGFSRGMKQRLGIAQALLPKPLLLMCDEPTSALDPLGRKEILDLLVSVKKETTVLFSTHILSDVERICTDVAFLDNGRIISAGKAETLKRAKRREEFIVEPLCSEDVAKFKSRFANFLRLDKNLLIFEGGEELMHEVIGFIAERKIAVNKIERVEPSLESLFMEAAE